MHSYPSPRQAILARIRSRVGRSPRIRNHARQRQNNIGHQGTKRYIGGQIMKSSALASLLAGAVIVCALTTAWLSTQYYFSMRDLQKLQGQYLSMNNSRTAVQALAN